MESKHGIKKITIPCLLIAATTILYISIRNHPSGETLDGRSVLAETDTPRQGYLICRLGNGYFSNIFRQLNGTDCPFSHIGIIDEEDDSLYVIHAEASELTGIGKVKREPLTEFIEQSVTHQLFPITTDTIRMKSVEKARYYWQKETPFDADFDPTSDSAVYCTELVAHCINHALEEPFILPQGEIGGKRYFRLDDILRQIEGH